MLIDFGQYSSCVLVLYALFTGVMSSSKVYANSILLCLDAKVLQKKKRKKNLNVITRLFMLISVCAWWGGVGAGLIKQH